MKKHHSEDLLPECSKRPATCEHFSSSASFSSLSTGVPSANSIATPFSAAIFQSFPSDVLFLLVGRELSPAVFVFGRVCKAFRRFVVSNYVRHAITVHMDINAGEIRSPLPWPIHTKELRVFARFPVLNKKKDDWLCKILKVIERFTGYKTLRVFSVGGSAPPAEITPPRTLPNCTSLRVFDSDLFPAYVVPGPPQSDSLVPAVVYPAKSGSSFGEIMQASKKLWPNASDVFLLGDCAFHFYLESVFKRFPHCRRLCVSWTCRNIDMLLPSSEKSPVPKFLNVLSEIHIVEYYTDFDHSVPCVFGTSVLTLSRRFFLFTEALSNVIIYIPLLSMKLVDGLIFHSEMYGFALALRSYNVRACLSDRFVRVLKGWKDATPNSYMLSSIACLFLFSENSWPVIRDEANGYTVRELSTDEYVLILGKALAVASMVANENPIPAYFFTIAEKTIVALTVQ